MMRTDFAIKAIGATVVACTAMTALAVTAAAYQVCVTCTDPAKTYLCNVETANALGNEKGLQLFCIIRTSRDGGHRSCSADQNTAANCTGEIKSYSFDVPQIPDSVRRALAKRRTTNPSQTDTTSVPAQKGGEPETLIDLTRGAVGASKEGIKNTGHAVGSAASTTKDKVGQAARGVGKGVTTAAGKVGSATKKTGGAVGGAAKTAWDCVKSLFKGCNSSP